MGNLTYKALRAATAKREKACTRNAESVKRAADNIKEIADDTRSDADALASKSVDPDSRSECQELAKIIEGLSTGAISYASKASDTARAAKAAGDEAKESHGDFQEAFDRSDVTDLEKVSNTWLEQD